MFCYVRLLTGYPRSKTRAVLSVLSIQRWPFQSRVCAWYCGRAKRCEKPPPLVIMEPVCVEHTCGSLHFWKGHKQTNKQTNKQTHHLSLKSVSSSPFFLPQQLKNHTHGIFHQHCSPWSLLSPRNDFAHIGLGTGKRHGRITAHGVHAVNVADFLGTKRFNGSDHSYLFFWNEVVLSQRNETETQQVNCF